MKGEPETKLKNISDVESADTSEDEQTTDSVLKSDQSSTSKQKKGKMAPKSEEPEENLDIESLEELKQDQESLSEVPPRKEEIEAGEENETERENLETVPNMEESIKPKEKLRKSRWREVFKFILTDSSQFYSNYSELFKEKNGDEKINSGESRIFDPYFYHQLFTKQEEIKGYKNLKYRIYFSPSSYSLFLEESYDEYQEGSDPVTSILKDHFRKGVTSWPKEFKAILEFEKDKFKPEGKLYKSKQHETDPNITYEFYRWSLADEEFKENTNKRLQAILWFFIETASFIENTPDWSYFMLYEVIKKEGNKAEYLLLGYITVEEYIDKIDKERKILISQVLILPPYHRQGHARRLTKSIYKYYLENENEFKEFHVEKPVKAYEKWYKSVEVKLIQRKGYFCLLDNELDHPWTEAMGAGRRVITMI